MRSRALKIWVSCLLAFPLAGVLVPCAILWCIVKGAWAGLLEGVYQYTPTLDTLKVLLYGLRHPMDAAKSLEQPETPDA